jgi:2-methylcitrate dehydratase
MDATITRLAEFAAGLSYEQLPAEVVDLAVGRLIDALGCAVGGMGSEQARIALAVSPRLADDDEGLPGLVLGSPRTTVPELAAFANSCMVRNLDFNDRYPHIHPSDMIGGLLATVGAPGVDGKRLVSAIVAAYEVATRIADAVRVHSGWDSGYSTGIGAVAGNANLLGCDTRTTGEALSLIATANVHLRSTRAGALSHWKGAATAHATFNAMFMTRLAQQGMTGPEKAIEGRHGLWDQITGQFEVPALPDRGGEYLIRRTSLKYWPVEYTAQNAVWAAKRLASSIPIEELATVRLGAHTHGWREIGSEPAKWDPRSRETADHSMPYIFVKAMQHDGVDLSIFSPESYLDPAVRPLMAKVVVEPDERCDAVHPDGVMLTCDAVAKDGRAESFSVCDPKGFWTNPMTASDVESKFLGLVEPRYGASDAASLYRYWSSVVDQPELTDGMRLFAGAVSSS